ncbi:MAG TPA: MaoC/PaaZ C-terminal domain-containing protein [Actinomycetota bacterium]|nr:MaoC/PaaZ C-terminal domain-containing protein [Actinomycetota bacterium]
MALNTSLQGKAYPESTFEVTEEAIHKYAAATNEKGPAFTGDNPVGPPAFPIVAAGPSLAGVLFDPDLGVNLALMVHGEEDHVLHAPIRAGDSLTVATTLETVAAKETGETFTVLSTLKNGESTVAEVRSLMFIRGTSTGPRPKKDEEPERTVEFEVSETIDEDQTYRYAEASGDHNPIHVDPDFAKNVAGLPGIICHGMCTMAFAARAVLDSTADGDPARLYRIKVRFSRPVFPGQMITTRVWKEVGESGLQTYGFETFNPAGQAVIKSGLAEVGA